MNSDEIGKMQATLEGAFPTAKLSPTKVFDAWTHSKVLVEFPNTRRADLTRWCIDNCRDFPTLAQLEQAAKALLKRDQPKHQTCLMCDDTGWVHYEPTGRHHSDGSPMSAGDPFTTRRVRMVAGKETTLQYAGVPIEYATPRLCTACNH